MTSRILSYYNTTQLEQLRLTADDVYQTAAYCEMDSRLLQADPILISAEDGQHSLALPLLKRKIPSSISGTETLYDAISPYGYPGILSNYDDPQMLLNSIETCRQQAANNGIISIFIRLHPVHHTFTLPEHPYIKQLFHGQTVCVDLQRSIEQIRHAFSTGLKRDIRKLINTGYFVKINAWEHYYEFIEAYNETMTLHNASQYYFFNKAYFENLRKPELHTHLITAHGPAGELVSGALFFAYGDTVQYHLGGTRTIFRQTAASKIIFDEAIIYFKLDGRKTLHLGGGVGSAEDALFRFKAAFSKETARFSTLRIICNETIYHALSEKITSTVGSDISTNFFPLYRA